MNDAKDQKETSAADAPVEEQTAVGEPAPDEEDVAPDDLAARLQEAERQVADNHDQWLRAQAEMENLRKRTERQLEQARKYAIEGFAFEMLTVKDTLELALREGEDESGDASGENNRREGVELTLKVLAQAFDKFGIEEIDPREESFDPERHQAMLTQPSDEHPQGTVLSVMQKGYSVCGRLLRPALVAVAGAAPDGGCDGDGNSGSDGGDAENLKPPEEKG